MSASKQLRRRRNKLFEQSNRCRKCRVEMVLPDEDKIKDNTATIQHRYGKYHPLRGKVKNSTTLWCSKCNLEDGTDWGLVIEYYGLEKKVYRTTTVVRDEIVKEVSVARRDKPNRNNFRPHTYTGDVVNAPIVVGKIDLSLIRPTRPTRPIKK